ncbi:BfmA/BtgA family mobilization protein [Fulvivirga lutea]|uniref:Uncharacterized protein n=1 Tax=Fulvivirga lutea TaxID=2810512 RepID=A0A975A2D9_9BACT|nr:BfmA/BtgA family mobilization protein [Fulvivirga lutea]QSE99190.1 hypothetical protein JR347_08905 [Fulvivirga lutea]
MKNIQIEDRYDDILQKLKNRLDMSKKAIIEQAIIYMDRNKINPSKYREGDPTEQVKKLKDQVVGYFKVHEKEHLKPLTNDVRLVVKGFSQQMSQLPTKEDIMKYLIAINNSTSNMEQTLVHLVNFANNNNFTNDKKTEVKRQALKSLKVYHETRNEFSNLMNVSEVDKAYRMAFKKIQNL